MPISSGVDTGYRTETPLWSEQVSPELALVDPTLAAAARHHLTELGHSSTSALHVDTRSVPLRPTSARHFREVASLPARVSNLELALAGAAGRWASTKRWQHRGTLPAIAAAVLGIAVAVSAVHNLYSFGPSVSGHTGDETTLVGERRSPTITAQGRQPVNATSSDEAATGKSDDGAGSRRLAWAPVAGASVYRVELYAGSERIYSATAPTAQIAIPSVWRSGNKLRRLLPGEYRWYVWPILSGKRAPAAIVQAELTVR